MEVSALSSNGLTASAGGTPQALDNSPVDGTSAPSGDVVAAEDSYREDCIGCREGRSTEIFRQEVERSVVRELGVTATARKTPYADAVSTSSSEAAVADTLGMASRYVAENPDVSSRAVIFIRKKVEEAAAITKQTVAGGDDIDGVDDALRQLNAGLDDLDSSASRNVESSASVLSIDTLLRQRSTIRIRTQEGDVVRFDLKRADRLSGQDAAIANELGTASETRVAVSSRSRLSLIVRGDLNEAESAAIRGVFEQAERIANEFFDGDLSAAFALATSITFDSEQLSRVNLRFRSREVTNVAFAQVTTRRTEAVSAPDPRAVTDAGAGEQAVPAATTPVSEAIPTPSVVEPPAPSADPDPAGAPPSTGDASDTAGGDGTFLRFFELLSDFLQNVARGFESLPNSDGGSFRYHYSQSFKLQILKSVIQVAAPEDKVEAADRAASLIDTIADSTDDR